MAGIRDRAFEIEIAELRRRTGSKWTRYEPDVIAAFVADMDFPTAPVVAAALHAAVDRGDLGYPPVDGGVAAAFSARAETRWGWNPDPHLITLMPDVVQSIERAIDVFTKPGQAVLVTTPVYPPFLKTVRAAGRLLAECPLSPDGSIDESVVDAAFAGHDVAMVLLCSPHNPSGRVLRRRELEVITVAALEHGAVIVSDEIHADVVYAGSPKHIPTALISPDVAANTVTLTSASKAFNLAGLRCAQVVAGRPELLAAMRRGVAQPHEAVGALGIVATLAAWSPDGDAWLARCLSVLDANRRRVADWADELDGVEHRSPQATYLAWLDFRRLGVGDDPAHWLLGHARVALSRGLDFGSPGAGFARLNFATTPAILDLILERIGNAIAAASVSA